METSEFPLLQELETEYSIRALKLLSSEDLNEAITATWRLFSIECKKFLQIEDDREGNFNVRLIDELGEAIELGVSIGQLHHLRMARNAYDKGSETDVIPSWELVSTGLETTERMLREKAENPEFSSDEIQNAIDSNVCPKCGKEWEEYEECDWCGFSHSDE